MLAENVAEKWNISRREQDEFAANSQKKCQAAQEAGLFNKEIVPITIKSREGNWNAWIAFVRTFKNVMLLLLNIHSLYYTA